MQGSFDLSQIYHPEATITPATENVYTSEAHVIRCTLSNIIRKVTGVTWNPAEPGIVGYDLEDGNFSATENSQVSTLTISAAKLTSLRKSAAVHTFTCAITVRSRLATATKTITIYHPSKIYL